MYKEGEETCPRHKIFSFEAGKEKRHVSDTNIKTFLCINNGLLIFKNLNI